MRQFLKQVFASIVGTIIALSVLSVIGATSLVLLIMTAASFKEEVVVEDKSILVLNLATPIRDTEPPSEIGEVLIGESTNTLTLRQVLTSLERIKDDDRIVAVFLDGSELAQGSPTGYAVLKEVRAALEELKKAGKKIIAYDVDLGEREYYLSSVADTIILNPMGGMEVNGLASEQLFLAGALNKFGIGVQIVRVGKYKSAVEPLIQQELSPENEQQIQALISDLWGGYVSSVAASRQLTPEKIQAIANNQGFLLPENAQSSGLVDQVAYFDEVIADLKKLTGEDEDEESFRQISLRTYDNVTKEATDYFSDNQIAVVYAQGSIVNGQGGVEEIGGDRFSEELRMLRKDDDVKAIVLRIDSPGGSATASEVILREIQLITKDKPVIVSMGNVAASGGYWIAIGGDYIFAEPNTITGSIGVFGILPNVEELANENGITWDVVKTNELANIKTLSRPKTEQELQIYQNLVNQVYDKFLNKVAKARNLPKEKVAEIAQGRVWSGEDAKAIGLVDKIGGLNAAIEYAAQAAELGDDWEVRDYPDTQTLEEQILERLVGDGETQEIDLLTAEFLKLKEELQLFQTLNDPKGIYVRLPFNLRIE